MCRKVENKNHQPDNKTKLDLDVSQNMINDLLKPLEKQSRYERGRRRREKWIGMDYNKGRNVEPRKNHSIKEDQNQKLHEKI